LHCDIGNAVILIALAAGVLVTREAEASLPSLPPGQWYEKSGVFELLIESGNRIRLKEGSGNHPLYLLHTSVVVRNEFWTDFDSDDTPFEAERLIFIFNKDSLELLVFKGGSVSKRLEFTAQKLKKP
jgi:hypothetical protein